MSDATRDQLRNAERRSRRIAADQLRDAVARRTPEGCAKCSADLSHVSLVSRAAFFMEHGLLVCSDCPQPEHVYRFSRLAM